MLSQAAAFHSGMLCPVLHWQVCPPPIPEPDQAGPVLRPVPLWDRAWWSSPLHRGMPTHSGMARHRRYCPSHVERDQCPGNRCHGLYSAGGRPVRPSCPRPTRPYLSRLRLLDQGTRFPTYQHCSCLLEASASPPYHQFLPSDY